MIDPGKITAILVDTHWIYVKPGSFRVERFEIGGNTAGALNGFTCKTSDGHEVSGVLAAIKIARHGR